MSWTDTDRRWMLEALELAARGVAQASPNPLVGAVVVDAEGRKVGEGFHTYEGVKHAEALALEQAGVAARGGTLYVTLEPCSHYGRTAPCADAVVESGVARVVCPLEDENPQVQGGGFDKLRAGGVEVEIAEELRGEAHRLNEAFFHYIRTGTPFVTLKTAATLDGKIAAPDDNSGWITSETARAHVQKIRHAHDAILTGIGTVLQDDPQLTDRSGLPRRRPLLRIIADSLCRLPLESKLVESFQDDLVIVTTSAAVPKRREALEQRGIPVYVMDAARGRVDLRAVVDWLGKQHMTSLMIEAGAKLNWAALDEEIVNKLLIYYAPKILGGLDSLPMAGGVGRRSRSGAIQLHGLRTFMVGPDEFAVEAYT
ncbi:MAG: bifunctional diaminohydroxyphosphoribosylaminopyrimidine deaminase/5-amino-6-(5-phosphoribosylamino)uracil reductase RibD [Acidobacteria bacterium]|nr:bifunctional diaminohydroxyphosphoribosylaminopyrimidine deaminase/5-amino-6-(5-phosphoribosylamino)uracil reductase RibD [Acidobacteriota bacterium]